jgi:hypothetical protein
MFFFDAFRLGFVPWCALLVFGLFVAPGWADQNSGSYAEIVFADRPIAHWPFNEGANVFSSTVTRDDLPAIVAQTRGDVRTGQPGPRPSVFPLFDESNFAIELPGNDVYLRVTDQGENRELKFDAGDSITLEAWVAPASAPTGAYIYVVGKGRVAASSDNQNYALRLFGKGDSASVSFLFRSRGEGANWHRWTSDASFALGDGWHHVAVTYTFGKADSIRGYLDGESVPGKWDMGGATDRAPVVDDDELWIGAAMGGKGDATFRGALDEVAIYRSALTAERVRARFKYVASMPELDLARVPENGVLVEIFEGLSDKKSWDFRPPQFVESYVAPSFGFPATPNKYTLAGVLDDRRSPYLIRATGYVQIPEGSHRVLVRGRNASRLYIDGQKVVETPFYNISNSGHGKVWELDAGLAPNIRALRRGDQQAVATVEGGESPRLVQLETIVGGQRRRPELGDTCVCIAPPEGDFRILGGATEIPFTEQGWESFVVAQRDWLAKLNAERRKHAGREETRYWEARHELARAEVSKSPPPQIPALPTGYSGKNPIDNFVSAALAEAKQPTRETIDDEAFLRRATVDIIGLIPSREIIDAYYADAPDVRRANLINRLLEHPSWADNWMGYWQDVLAENPNIVNPTLNNTGPFRWWLHESFTDNKPFDRLVAELVMMEGSQYFGGPAGFGMASQNDAPMAAKAHIVGKAFLGLEMNCARCHDAPFHDFLQKDLFSLAAMLKRDVQSVPKTSTVPVAEGDRGSLLVSVTLEPGANVEPEWPFPELSGPAPDGAIRRPGDTREQLAAMITGPQNKRFAQVIVNRVWRRYLGWGLVEPVDDWENAEPSHPALLDWLAREFVTHDYDLKHIARLILTSHVYQRSTVGKETIDPAKPYLFAGPVKRRMTAEQVVDSLFVACGKPFDAGPMNVDIDSSREHTQSLNLGDPTRAWMFASLSNERDRPSLALPLAQPFVEVLETFGWRSSRQDPLTVREEEPTVLQPGVLANGILGRRVTRLSDDSAFTALALEEQSLDQLVERVYLQILSRRPTAEEQLVYRDLLQAGFDERRVPDATPAPPQPKLARDLVGWSNHLAPEATTVKTDLEKVVRAGDPPTTRLTPEWRERLEDMIWALTNSPEFVFIP